MHKKYLVYKCIYIYAKLGSKFYLDYVRKDYRKKVKQFNFSILLKCDKSHLRFSKIIPGVTRISCCDS